MLKKVILRKLLLTVGSQPQTKLYSFLDNSVGFMGPRWAATDLVVL